MKTNSFEGPWILRPSCFPALGYDHWLLDLLLDPSAPAILCPSHVLQLYYWTAGGRVILLHSLWYCLGCVVQVSVLEGEHILTSFFERVKHSKNFEDVAIY